MDGCNRYDSRVSERLRRNLTETLDHTTRVVQNVVSFAFDPDGFQHTYSVDISSIPVTPDDAENLAVLAWIHDLWRIISKTEHAEEAGKFLADATNVSAVRFHDRFGVIHTGEASFLFLDELAQFLEGIPRVKVDVFLNYLRILTIVDVASYGYLDRARIRTYQYLVDLLKEVPNASELEEIARNDTVKRIKRLIEANNRVDINEKLVSQAMECFPDKDTLENGLVSARFDYGAYSLEPLFRRVLLGGKEHLLDHKVKATATDVAPVTKFLECLHDLLSEDRRHKLITVSARTVGRRTLYTYNMKAVSIKGDANLQAFDEWSSQYIE